jgi:Putative transposase
VTADTVAQVQASLRKRKLRAFVGRGLLESFEAKEMLGYKHSGFSVDTSVCIAAQDRARLAALVPPPRTHRHRYFGVLAPHSPHRAAVTAMTQRTSLQALPTVQVQVQVQAEPVNTGVGVGVGALGAGNPLPIQAGPAQPVQPKRPAHYLWAVLIARIYEVFPLLCPI